MLKIIIDKKNGPPMIAANGSLVEILSGLSLAVSGIYRTLGQSSPDAAEAFKRAFQEAVTQEDGPVWNNAIPGIMIGYHTPMKED